MSCESVHHIGDIGTSFKVTIVDFKTRQAIPVTTATSIKFSLLKPNGTTVSKTGSFFTDGSDGIVKWVTTSANDLDIKGTWKAQVHVVLADGSWYTERFSFSVDSNIIQY